MLFYYYTGAHFAQVSAKYLYFKHIFAYFFNNSGVKMEWSLSYEMLRRSVFVSSLSLNTLVSV